MNKANNILIGGGMAFTFVKAMGGTIGKSLCEDDKLELAKELLIKAKAKGVNLYIPKDAVIADNFANDAATQHCNINEIPEGWMGLDIKHRNHKHLFGRDKKLKNYFMEWANGRI